MTKVLLTGGSGFIAAHILDQLVSKGHLVVTTVRSEEKARQIRQAYPGKSEEQLKVVLVPDIAKPDAFDEVVKIPGIEVVLHTASPFHFRVQDVQKDLIDPAVIGTTGILKAIAKSAPGVKRVVVTSSFAAILSETKLQDPATTFTEASWNPITLEDVTGTTTPTTGYRASKTLAERAAWDFVADPQGSGAAFDLATINPPLVFGPLAPSQWVAGLDAINTSNERLVDLLRGKWKTEIPSTGGTMLWIDVRDVATAHIKAGLEVPEAGGKRLFATQGEFSNREILEIVRKNFPEFADKVPAVDVKGGELSEKRFKFDNSTTTKLLGIDWIPLEKSIVDTVNSLKSKGA